MFQELSCHCKEILPDVSPERSISNGYSIKVSGIFDKTSENAEFLGFSLNLTHKTS